MNMTNINWQKVNDMLPVIVQDHATLQVLMLGYMDPAALQQTCATGKVTFYSRTKQRLWTKGEISGHELNVMQMYLDCDQDTLLIAVRPAGPCCHLDNTSCFSATDAPGLGILAKLETLIKQRYQDRPANSYTTKLFADGIQRIAQKVGEEGVEVALASVTGSAEQIKNEAADLIFHLLVLLRQCNVDCADILEELRIRHKTVKISL
jgi:phosphoribosyl-ATP pyrophosphohydrolase/phosphoribosyl-AMP cyclohydrolase